MKLGIISFNIRCCDDRNGHSVAERAPRLYSAIAKSDPDLIGIQEFTPIWEDRFNEMFSSGYVMFNKYRATSGWIEGGPLLWKKDRFSAEKQGYFWYSDTPDEESGGWDITGHKRICTYAVLLDKTSGERFVFMNTHFGFGDDCQIKSALLIKERIAQFGSLPLFITGDFNAAPDSPAYKTLVSFLEESNEDKKEITYHAYAPGSPDCAHIDYCFHNGGFRSLGASVVTDTFDGRFPSDHYGLHVCLET